MYTRFVMLRDLERTPVISQDGVVLSKKVQRDIRRLAVKLKARGPKIDKRWRRKAQAIFGKELDPPRLRALAAINPGSWWTLLANGRINDFLEQVEYHGRRLPGDQVYELTIDRPLEDFPTDDDEHDTRRLVAALEAHIRSCPEQYWWIHKRFKGRPPPYPDIYATQYVAAGPVTSE